jgi:hypothetical protein
LFRGKRNNRIVQDLKAKPRPYPANFRSDGGVPLCACRSSIKMNFLGFKLGCLQPNCSHYFKGFPSEDINEKVAVYLNGKYISRWRCLEGD